MIYLNHYYNNDLANKAPSNHNHNGVYQPVGNYQPTGNYALRTYNNWAKSISFTMISACAIVLIDQIFEVIWFAGDNNISLNYNGNDFYNGTNQLTITKSVTQTIKRNNKTCTITFSADVSLLILYY